jgi:hypothetical protein
MATSLPCLRAYLRPLCVCESEQKKDTMSLQFCSWLMSFGEFMYGKMCCAYMISCVAGGEAMFGKMRHRQQRYGRRPVKMSYLHEAMRLVCMWHAKMRQRGPVVQSGVWGRCCVQVLVCEALQLKCVTIKGSGELYHKGRRYARTADRLNILVLLQYHDVHET